MTQVEAAFAAPASRLQLLILLDCFTTDPEFQLLAPDFARHPLMNSLLNSLLLDNSSTTCAIGLTMLVKLLPIFAVKVCEELKIFLPRLFVILARIICWEELSTSALPSTVLADDDDGHLGAGEQPEVSEELAALELRPELGWEKLELRLNTSAAPPSDAYFSSLYYLFPCNLILFVRGPAAYMRERDYESPYIVSWEDALDEDNIRSKSEVCTPTLYLCLSICRSRSWHLSTHLGPSSQPCGQSTSHMARLAQGVHRTRPMGRL